MHGEDGASGLSGITTGRTGSAPRLLLEAEFQIVRTGAMA